MVVTAVQVRDPVIKTRAATSGGVAISSTAHDAHRSRPVAWSWKRLVPASMSQLGHQSVPVRVAASDGLPVVRTRAVIATPLGCR
jgi:hypothetical protein